MHLINYAKKYITCMNKYADYKGIFANGMFQTIGVQGSKY